MPEAGSGKREAEYSQEMPYSEMLIAPMRGELTALGAKELKTSSSVDAQLKSPGTTLLVVNSVCGCAAGRARPGVAMALGNKVKPDTLATVFAGADIEATARARELLAPYPPSSVRCLRFDRCWASGRTVGGFVK